MEGIKVKKYFKYNFLFYLLIVLVTLTNLTYLVYKGMEERKGREDFLRERVEEYMGEVGEELRGTSARYLDHGIIDMGEFNYLLRVVEGRWKIYSNWDGRWRDIELQGERYFLEKRSEGIILMDGRYYIYGKSVREDREVYSMWEIDQKFLEALEEKIGIEVGISSEVGIHYLIPVVNSPQGLKLYFNDERSSIVEAVVIGGYFFLVIAISLLHLKTVRGKIEEEEERVVEEVKLIKSNKINSSPVETDSIFFNINMAIKDLGERYLKKTGDLNMLRRRLTHTNLQLREVAIIDRLTGLYNKLFLYEVLNDLKKNRASRPYYSIVMMVDLDNFKRLNDTYGHLAGDRLLREIGDFLKKTCGEKGLAFRYGGDEFFIVFKQIRYEDFLELASYFEEEREEIIRNYIQVKLGMSTGAIILKDDEEYDVDKIIKEVDELLYEAKKKGKNQVVFKI
ncbi:hypothetical protein PM10SUCC1_13530 [Propionigenium maris DSM 9537]|uniref:GGDEF domain-containing protein n=1 Tax=Propionigenium maris DSM 9537 TaxID=1123000 RepID=A0A9W6GIJ8_9FUSO|nr:GGDEF domain-containing protein [Propionigenium maris]GLI55839.1 hypothetical protein PM10SUCC1_13530 [Propionigenium maris DSM 9537]